MSENNEKATATMADGGSTAKTDTDNTESHGTNAGTTKASNTVAIDGATLTVSVNGLDKLWSLTGGMRIPLTHVMGATVDPGMSLAKRKAVRAPGLSVPGKHAGTFRFKDGDTEFWNVAQPEQPLVIQLRDEKYSRLVLGVADPRGTADLINGAIS
ncbi:hypothetical protein PT282_02220 [Bifidobacterium sp. ESL0763]|uniref:hypothetical protein n=1 Tax=Bifidobacterium sp. ESL0763 TaxID=2983227 RepID=UPI0023F964C9|nr:hypothetical protein [Bifidobacterium sp. ESL0763]MDF7663491.1 hypothetical protein [Bifidobacterium sp. ESL0763]